MRSKIFILSLALLGFVSSGTLAQDNKFVTIGTGGVTGVYYPLGGAICKLVNTGKKDHGLRCSVESTGGSVYNLNAIKAGELDFGVAQADLQDAAYKGTGDFAKTGANKDLRAVFAVFPEAVTIVVRADSGINKLEDLKGKRVNIGNPGSGTRNTMEQIMKEMGWTKDDFKLASELKPSEHSTALCDNHIDAFAYVVASPNGSIQEAASACEVKVIDVTGPAIDKIVASAPYYLKSTIPAGMYKGTEKETHAYGMPAMIVTSAKIDDETVYQFVKSVFTNFDEFKNMHQAFGQLKKENMTKDGITIPLHPGAIKYYKEVGLMK